MIANMVKKLGIHLLEIKGFVGVIGSGKDYQCKKLTNEGFIQLGFADCLRDMVWKMLNWKPKNEEEYDLFKKGLYPIPVYGKLDGRLLLQRIGETMREIDPDFWVKQMKQKIERTISAGHNKICISDVRYPNELKMLQSYSWKGMVNIRFCDYHSSRYNDKDKHQSEALAQKLLTLGFEDGDIISKNTIDRL